MNKKRIVQDGSKDSRRDRAAALQYCAQTGTPRILAMGAGDVARKIVEMAEEHGVPVRQDGELLSLLQKIKVGSQVPEEAERLLAEILCFLYAVDKAAPASAALTKNDRGALSAPRPEGASLLEKSVDEGAQSASLSDHQEES